MRTIVASCVILLAFAVASPNAERAWKTGTWGPRDGRSYIIETARQILTARPTGAEDLPIEARPGTALEYAVEGRQLYVHGTGTTEYALELIGSAEKYSTAYAAVGSGHYIKAVSPDGTTVTLEDGSRWDMDPRQHFAVAAWQVEDLISVRRSNDDPDFTYEVDNTTQDDGALANYRVR